MPPRFGFPNNEKAWIALGPIAERDLRANRQLFAFGPDEFWGVALLLATIAALASHLPRASCDDGRSDRRVPERIDGSIPGQLSAFPQLCESHLSHC